MSELDTILQAVTAGFQQVNERLDRLEARVGNLENSMARLEARMGNLETDVAQLKSQAGKLEEKTDLLDRQVSTGFAEVHSRLDSLQQSVNRIEHQQQEEVIGMLRLVKGKTEIHEYKIDSLNKRLLDAEAHIQKVANQ